MQTKQNLLLQQHIISDSLSDVASIINTAILPTELPESNSRTMNEIVLQFKQDGLQSIASRYDEIMTIANQCPFEGGAAVIIARNIAEHFNDSLEYDDDAVCLENGIYKMGNESTINSKVQGVRIVPNPASKYIEVSLLKPDDGICKIEILNQLGEVLLKTKLSCKDNNKRLNIEQIPPGVYAVKVLLNSNYFQTEKLIIVR